jgi:serine/threonine protein kinase
MSRADIVHRDLKLENVLLKVRPSSNTDEFDIRVRRRDTCAGRTDGLVVRSADGFRPELEEEQHLHRLTVRPGLVRSPVDAVRHA